MTQTALDNLLEKTEKYARQFFEEQISDEYVFHDIEHTESVVESVVEISEGFNLSEREKEILQIAAWFHDMGYNEGPLGHEERSSQFAAEFLRAQQYPERDIELIVNCIKATKIPQQPQTLLEGILCDADLSHIGKKTYWDRCGKIRQELIMTKNVVMSEQEWVDFELNFMIQHRYHTTVASTLYEKRKQKHIRQLYKQKSRLYPDDSQLIPIPPKPGKKKKKPTANQLALNQDFEIKQISLGRGVETMYRTTYRTHTNLSSIADNKANIMLSINAIIISIVVSTLVPTINSNPKLVIPTVILLAVCLASVVLATLSTRPKVTEGKFTREDIENKSANLLFFGNYYNMEIDDFHWGMMEMIKDSDFLYSSMTRDLYYLGKVLAWKYRYLSWCFSVFMYGLIVAVIAYAIAFIVG